MHDLFAPAKRVASDDQIITTPVHVRDGVTAYLNLPRRLSPAEAERIAAMVRAWAIEPEETSR